MGDTTSIIVAQRPMTEVRFSSSDESVAIIEDGSVKGVSAGTATITGVMTVDGTDYSAVCEIEVTE